MSAQDCQQRARGAALINLELFREYEEQAIVWGRKFTHPRLSRELLDNTALIGLFKAVLKEESADCFMAFAHRAVCNEVLELIRNEGSSTTRAGLSKPILMTDCEDAERYEPLDLGDPALTQQNLDLYNFCVSVLTPLELDIVVRIHIYGESQASYARSNALCESVLNRQVESIGLRLRQLVEWD